MENNISTSNMVTNLTMLVRWKRFIIFNVIAVTLLSVGISFLIPSWYKATASILPPKEQDLLSGLGGASSLLKGLSGSKSLGALSKGQAGYNYFAILRSRSASEKVIQKFGLMEEYDISDNDIDKTIKELTENTRFETQEEDNITIEVFDKSPVRAAEMANYYVTLLNEMSIALGTHEAMNNRVFIEKRLEQCYTDLRKAEDELKRFQEKTGVIIIQDEKNSNISAYAELYAIKAKKEIEVAVLKRNVTPDNSLLQQTKIELNELTKKLESFPRTGLEGLRLYREVAIQQKILEFVLPIYEQSKVDEQKDVPILLVLDHAVPPVKKDKPKRLIIIGFSCFFALALSIMFVYLFTVVLNAAAAHNDRLLEYWKEKIHTVVRFYKINLPQQS